MLSSYLYRINDIHTRPHPYKYCSLPENWKLKNADIFTHILSNSFGVKKSFARVWADITHRTVPEHKNMYYVIPIFYSHMFSAVSDSHMVRLTNENTVLLWRKIYFCALNRSMRDFCLYTHKGRQAEFYYYLINYDFTASLSCLMYISYNIRIKLSFA